MGQFPTLYVESRSLTLSETLRQAGQMDAADRIERDREVILALVEALEDTTRQLASWCDETAPEALLTDDLPVLEKGAAALRLAQQAGHGGEA